MSAAGFTGLTTIVVGASLAWACTAPDFGTPATPGNPPPPSADATSPPGAGPGSPTSGPASPGTVGATPAPATGTSGTGVTSGASAGARAPANSGAPARGGVVRRGATAAPVANGVASRQFAQRSSGATAGVARSGGKAVFGSPAAKAKGPRAARATRSRATPSARSASGDLWSGFKPQARSSVFAAEASAGGQGAGGAMTAALLAVGLGVAGLACSGLVLGLRRRKAHAKAAGRSSTTE